MIISMKKGSARSSLIFSKIWRIVPVEEKVTPMEFQQALAKLHRRKR
jgi:hypothetical protein